MGRVKLYAIGWCVKSFFVIGAEDIIPATALIGRQLHFGLQEQLELYLDEFVDYLKIVKEILSNEQRSLNNGKTIT